VPPVEHAENWSATPAAKQQRAYGLPALGLGSTATAALPRRL